MDTKVADPLRGALIAGRYRIVERMGRRGPVTVYEARDERLDRPVAIKIVEPEHVLDAEVLERLDNEVQTVAHLPHPNIVAVYDQGTHDGAPYLVMEHVHGRTLHEVLADRGRLDPAESLAIIEQLLAALAVAHRAGLVHRDIKPDNILVAPPPNGSGDLVDSVVKVVDFGLARGADIGRSTAAPLLQAAPYVAPESITTGRADARSDVYSAGIVLFEMLTGRLPFTSVDAPTAAYPAAGQVSQYRAAVPDAPTAAWRHVDEEVPAPSRFADGIPQLLDGVVGRATRRDPSARPRDAAAMLADIRSAREDVGALAGPTRAIAHPTMIVPSVGDGAGRPGWSRLPEQRGGRGETATGTWVLRAEQAPGGLNAQMARLGTWLRLTGNRLRYTEKGRRTLIVGVAVLGVLLMIGGYWFGIGRYTQAPDLLQMTKQNALEEAASHGFTVEMGAPIYSEQVPADTVLAQQPAPGGRIVRGGAITVHLSLGPERYSIPDLAGKAYDFAVTQLPKQLIPEKVDGFSDTLPVGYVVGTDPPANTVVAPNTTVKIIVVKGPFPVHIPTVTGMSLSTAQSNLNQAGFTDIEVLHSDSDKPKDTVISQSPDAGTGYDAATGHKITLVVSNGPALKMPKVLGMDCNQASAQLTGMGLVVNMSGLPSSPMTKITTQDPAENTAVTAGQTVTLSCGL